MKLLKLLLTFLVTINSYAINVELVARADEYGSFNLPETSFISNSTIQNSSSGAISFNFATLYNEEVRMGLWIQNVLHPNGKTLYLAQSGNYISDPSLNDRGDITFVVYNEFDFIGLFLYDFKSDSLTKVMAPDSSTLISIANPRINNNQDILFRAGYKSGEKAVVIYKNGDLQTIVSDKNSEISYLFNANFIDGDNIALKVREGSSLSDTSPDSLRVYKGEDNFERVNYDNDYSEESTFSDFNNSLGSHFSSKHMAFIAKMKSGKRVLVRQLGNRYEIIATEGEGGIKTLEYFAPAVNSKGFIAFRAINSTNKRGIFFYDGFVIREVLSEGNLVQTDASTAVIHAAKGPCFGGGLSLNSANEIVIQARIYTKYKEKALGTAVLKISL